MMATVETKEARLERKLWNRAKKDPWLSQSAEQLADVVNANVEDVAEILKASRSFRELVVHDAKGKVMPRRVAYRPERVFRELKGE